MNDENEPIIPGPATPLERGASSMETTPEQWAAAVCTCDDPEKAGGNMADGSHWVACPVHDREM